MYDLIEGISCREGENESLQFTVGSNHLQEAFERGIVPTAKCRKCKKGKKMGNPSNVDYPSKQ
ncbi:MAG: hypothetical protein IJ476_08130 [Bacteroidales bacterium]|nr:hypothetical protein [Bacteroidales bacterium]